MKSSLIQPILSICSDIYIHTIWFQFITFISYYHIETQLIFCSSRETLLINMLLLILAKLYFLHNTYSLWFVYPHFFGVFSFPILWTTKMRKQCTMLEIEDSLSEKLYSPVYPYIGPSYSYDIILTYNICFMIIVLIIMLKQLSFCLSIWDFII